MIKGKNVPLDKVKEMVSLRHAGLKLAQISEFLNIQIRTIGHILSGTRRSKETGITRANHKAFFNRVRPLYCILCSKRRVGASKYCAMHRSRIARARKRRDG